MPASLSGVRGSISRVWPTWLTRDLRWLLAVAVTAYVLYITRNWRFPTSNGVTFPGLWAVLVVGSSVVWRLARGRLGPVEFLAVLAAWGMVLGDVTQFWSQAFRDLHIYVKAGEHFLDGEPVYMTEVLRTRPDDLSNYPYLYPPLTLPLVAGLSLLPGVVVDWGWLGLSMAVAVWSLRRFGLSWPWAIAALLWPPFFQGLYVGNVAVPLLGLFAAAPYARRAAGLVIAPVFKLYSGVATLWLVGERRWRELAVGVVFVVFVALVTLPIVGVGSWLDWLNALRIYRQSEMALPNYLYGFGFPRYIPELAWVAVASVVVVAALGLRGKAGLARLGLATVVASPTVFAHGFLVAVPAFLSIRSVWLWASLGVTSVAPDLGWWAAVGVAVAAWFVPALRRVPATPDDRLHPLGRVVEPWPDVETAQHRRDEPIPARKPRALEPRAREPGREGPRLTPQTERANTGDPAGGPASLPETRIRG
jgi:hypothetical protein